MATPLRCPDESLCPGMYVRVPIDNEDGSTLADCRDYRIGQVQQLVDNRLTICLSPGMHDSFQQRQIVTTSMITRRCRLLAPAPFVHMPSQQAGTLLTACADVFTDGKPMQYYALLCGSVRIVSETDIRMEAHVQAPDPGQQLAEYEFHPPIWRSKRDELLESYIELQSATFGLEELVGSRILLLPHQAMTIARALGDRVCRYILADEVGLGKTIEASVILRGLRRRNPALKALILAPHTLAQQWHQELNSKFWLEFSLVTQQEGFSFDPSGPGVVLSVEDLDAHPHLIESLLKRTWDLLIVDEAHRLQRQPRRYQIVRRLSAHATNCLILSATPILRHAAEYLALLRLMHPQRYGAMQAAQFEEMLVTQSDFRKRLAYVGRSLNTDDFDADEFHEEMDPLVERLSEDPVLPGLLSAVLADSLDRGLKAAQEVHSYLSENYRIEARVIRNRRASIAEEVTLPTRTLEERYAYNPNHDELETLADLTDYGEYILRLAPDSVQMYRILQYAAASSPFALRSLIEFRKAIVAGATTTSALPVSLRKVLSEIPAEPEEGQYLARMLWHVEQWLRSTLDALEALRLGSAPSEDTQHRLLQVLRAVRDRTKGKTTKLLVFCRWAETYSVLKDQLIKHYGRSRIAFFHLGMNADELQSQVDRFQADSECIIMLTDETGGEGRNFQIANAIIHVEIPWTPAQIEQRIGRVDRIGRAGVVESIVIYARHTLESDLFGLWQGAFELFTRSLSGMEIVLETILDEITEALAQHPREGLTKLLPLMAKRMSSLREVVEEERYAEESAAQHEHLGNLGRTLDDYRDGTKLKVPLLRWADMAGLPSYSQCLETNDEITVFNPRNFVQASIANAKFVNPPNMEEALRRSRRARALVLRGTFDRDLAVRREDLVFFAPGEPWTDALIANALYSDRGQCTAIKRMASELSEDWEGFECLYSVRVNPCPLYEAGGDPVHLFHAQGYLTAPCIHVVVGTDGQVLKRSSAVWRVLERPFKPSTDIQLGKRSGECSPLRQFMERFPQTEWQRTVRVGLAAAEAHVRAEYEFMTELADEARADFSRSVVGQRAAQCWLYGTPSSPDIDEYERIGVLLTEGIRQPLIRLESVCFWWLQAVGESQYGAS